MMPSLFDSQPVNACTDSTPDPHLSPPLSSLPHIKSQLEAAEKRR